MAKREEPSRRYRQAKEIFGVFWIAFTLLAVAGLVSYNPSDIDAYRSLSGGAAIQNLGGIVGAYLSAAIMNLFGAASFAVPVVTLALGLLLFREKTWKYASSLVAGGTLFMVSSCVLLNVFLIQDMKFPAIPAGGILGKGLAEKVLFPFFAKPGTAILGIMLLFFSILVATRFTVRESWELAWKYSIKAYELLSVVFKNLAEVFSRVNWKKPLVGRYGEKPEIKRELREETAPMIVHKEGGEPDAKGGELDAEQAVFSFVGTGQEYSLPPLSLLKEPKPVSRDRTEKELLVNSQILTKKLADFGIDGRVTMVLPGPVITLYEYEPAAGIKVSRIINLADDLAMGLRAVSVRILAPVPGKAVVGIEVPNRVVEQVTLKRILVSAEFKDSKSKLTIALGKDAAGIPFVTDLAKIPHLMVAGATGSGKSVGLNAMIMSILYKANPNEVKFIMIDPKMLELSVYDGIPHLITPVVTNPKKASNALRWAVAEMERRYLLLADLGFRHIESYNKWVEEFLEERESERKKAGKEKAVTKSFDRKGPVEEGHELKPLPYIVVVIDELADLIMVAYKDVEDALARLAQMARAAGIHLIIATQRPSVDILTGVIKANFPARISYQVTSRIDSRTILDTMGAEKLLGKGDLLFLPPGTSRLQRIHGPFVTVEEIKRTTDFLRKQGKPVYNEEILKAYSRPDNMALAEEDKEDEYYFEQAVKIVRQMRQASISMIQRKLRIGYNRAARIIEIMEAKGIVGPADGAKPRRVLISPEDGPDGT